MRLPADPVGELPAVTLRLMLRAVSNRGQKPMARYRHDPVGFAVDVLGEARENIEWSLHPEYRDHRWDGTKDPLVAIGEELAAGNDVGVESATGTGKTWWASRLKLWWLGCWEEGLVITTAPREEQLRRNLWKESRRAFGRFKAAFPDAHFLDLNIRMRGDSESDTVDIESWSALGMGCGVGAGEKVANRMRGFHDQHMLAILEEMTGIPPAVLEALEQTMTAQYNLRLGLGNPDSQQDELHRFCVQPTTKHIRISAYDYPNVVLGREVVPGAVTRQSIERRKARLGEDHRLFKSRVRGISPAEAVDALIKRALVDDAMARYRDPRLRVGPRALGVDVANSESGDGAAIARGLGRCLLEVERKPCPDALQLGREVAAEVRADGIDPKMVGVDSVGVGSNVMNGGAEEGLSFADCGGSRSPQAMIDWEVQRERDRTVVEPKHIWQNLRAQMWWTFRRDLERGLIALPSDPELVEDLVSVTWWTNRSGKIQIVDKDEIRETLGRSPDKGDAAVYWNWVRPRRTEEFETVEEASGRDVGADPYEEGRPADYDAGYEALMETLTARRKATRGF